METLEELFKDKVILVTGGLGSIGTEIVKQLLEYSPKEVRVFDNRETELFYFQDRNKDKRIHPILGDVRDRDTVMKVMKGVHIVFHAAAKKHVIISEQNPMEAVKTNVIGTQNVIEACAQHEVERFVMISTDKAVNPTNVMGATKLLAERLVSAFFSWREDIKTRVSIVRFGNVIASRGSVLEIWEHQLKEGKKITITDPEMTRFFMSIPESVKLIFTAALYGNKGETFIFKMPSVKIGDLAKVFLKMHGNDEEYYEVIGIKPGEKLHEELINSEEKDLLLEDDEMFVMMPSFYQNAHIDYFLRIKFSKSTCTSFSSGQKDHILDINKINKVLTHIH